VSTRIGSALVTGATRGIGHAIALHLARAGYDVVAVARNAAELSSLAKEIEAMGRACRTIVLDLSDATATARALDGIDVDVLINNAGIGVIKPFVELTPDEWNAMVNLNINALFHVTRAALPAMIRRGAGHVCTIGSIGGRSAWVGGSCYGATKAFVTSWSESLMLEVRDNGVKVSVIMPGGVATEFGGHEPSAADDWKLTSEEVAESVLHVISAPGKVLVHRLEIRSNTVRKTPKA
jgi:3-oxoacyl-[acyl-carrier protein] reductase